MFKGDLSYNLVIVATFLALLIITIGYLAYINPSPEYGPFTTFLRGIASFLSI